MTLPRSRPEGTGRYRIPTRPTWRQHDRLPGQRRVGGLQRAQLRGHARHDGAAGVAEHVRVAPGAAHGRRHGVTLLVAAGDQVADALDRRAGAVGCGAEVLLGLGQRGGVEAAQAALRRTPRDARITSRCSSTGAARRRSPPCSTRSAPPGRVLHGAIIMPAYGPAVPRAARRGVGLRRRRPSWTGELVGAIAHRARADALLGARTARRLLSAARPSSATDDGHDNAYADILRAAMEELARVWRDESEVQVGNEGAPPSSGPTRSSAGPTPSPRGSRSPPATRRA
jgi:hypothetical protein